jgi:hypothetical protein
LSLPICNKWDEFLAGIYINTDIHRNNRQNKLPVFFNIVSCLITFLFLTFLHWNILMNSTRLILFLMVITSLFMCNETSDCVPRVAGICGCCESGTTCKIVSHNMTVLNSSLYCCVPNEIATNFSSNHCNCTYGDSPICICFNRTHVFPIHKECDSFAECTITTMQMTMQAKIRGKLF